MLEHYFAQPKNIDRLLVLWLGPAIDRYSEWLASRQMQPAAIGQLTFDVLGLRRHYEPHR
jgi:hypothetical protein